MRNLHDQSYVQYQSGKQIGLMYSLPNFAQYQTLDFINAQIAREQAKLIDEWNRINGWDKPYRLNVTTQHDQLRDATIFKLTLTPEIR